MKKELSGSEFELTNDIDKYCDCLVDEYQKLPLNKVMKDEFFESKKAMRIDNKCTILSK